MPGAVRKPSKFVVCAGALRRRFALCAIAFSIFVGAGGLSSNPSNGVSGAGSHPSFLAQIFGTPAFAGDDSGAREMAREQRRQAREFEKEAAKQARQAEKDAAKLARESERDAAKMAKEQQRAAAQLAKEQEREAAKQAQDQEREAAKQAKEQEREAAKQAKEQERETAKQAKEQEREAAKQAKEQEREAAKQAKDQQSNAEREQKHTRHDDVGRDHQGRTEPRIVPTPVTTQPGAKETPATGGNGNNDHANNGNGNNAGGGFIPVVVPAYVPGDTSEPVGSGTGSQDPDQTTDSGTSTAADTSTQGKVNAPKKKKETEASKKANAKADGPKPGSNDRVSAADLKFPEFGRPEVLAINASAKTLQRAKELGFKTNGASSISSLNASVTKLLAPEGMTASAAETLLQTAEPQASVAVNQTYRLYKTATGAGASDPSKTVSAGPLNSGLHCGIDHCFGRDIIGWKPELRGCAAGLKIGIIDTSVDKQHPALSNKKIDVNHLSPDGAPGPDWHGTGVTALLAGDTSSGTPGLIPDASFYVADVFRADANDQPASDTYSMLRAFDWLEAKNVKIINMSLSGPPDALIGDAIKKLSAKGVLFVAAAGNEGPAAGPSYPAAYDEVIAVTAVGQNLKSYRYANRGTYIDVAAPGVAIWTAQPGAKEGYHSGTSFAAPYVTAALAAIYPRLPTKAPAEVLQYLAYRDLGDPGPDATYGQGLLVAPSSCNAEQIAKSPIRPAKQAAVAAPAKIKPAGIGSGQGLAPYEAAPDEVEVLPWLTKN